MNEPEQFHQYLKERGQSTDRDDKTLQAVIDGAKDWVAESRLHRGHSVLHLATNYLKDGFYHP